MSNRSLDSRHSIDSCTYQLHSWRPFNLQTLDSDPPKPYSSTKRPCLSDRNTSFSIDSIDISKLSIIDDDKPIPSATAYTRRGTSFRLIARKRRRRGSRSVSGRSSDRSGTMRCCSVGASAAHGTCSDIPIAVGTDSSGELFGNGDSNWGSDAASEARREKDREREEKDNLGTGNGLFGNFENQGNESGYGSEPGYRGDAEFGYEDEFDEEEEDAKLLYLGPHFGDPKIEMVGENTFSDQKFHHRCRRKKHDTKMVDSLR